MNLSILSCADCGYERASGEEGRWFDEVDGLLLCSECWYEEEEDDI